MADPMVVVVPGLPVLINFVLGGGGGGDGGDDGGGDGGNGGLGDLDLDDILNLNFDLGPWLDAIGFDNINDVFDEVDLEVPEDMPNADFESAPSIGGTPLIRAIVEGSLTSVKYLVEKGADPDELEKRCTTALHLAVLGGHVDVIEYLISIGADVDAGGPIGTPLQLACKLQDSNTLMLDTGADGPSTVSLVHTPLDLMSRSLECAKLLILAGADPSGISCGMSPLVSAAKKANIELLKCLLESGADPNTRDDIGLKPIEIAARKGNYREVEVLFPVTSPIPEISDWSIGGIMKHVHSKEVQQLTELKLKERHIMLKSGGAERLNEKDYLEAAYYFTEAMDSDPSDETVLSQRSFCLACLGDGGSAWADAKACMSMKPEWPEAYLRGGLALNVLERFDMAAVTLSVGMKLDPENKELQDAYQLTSQLTSIWKLLS